jgi:uncharacterized delta-60 repeat protein
MPIRTSITAAPIRYLSNGTLDPSFGNDGVADNPNSTTLSSVNSAVLEPDGSIALAGDGSDSSTGKPAYLVSHIESNGALDPSFGTNGTVSIVIPNNQPSFPVVRVFGMALQASGQLIVAGDTDINVTSSTGTTLEYSTDMIRLNSNGTQDLTFGGTSPAGQLIFDGTYGESLLQQPDGKILVNAEIQTEPGEVGDPRLLRLNADGSYDDTFGQGGVDLLPNGAGGAGVLQSNGQIIGGAGSAELLGSVGPTLGSLPQEFSSSRLNSNGTLDTSYGNSAFPGVALYHFGAPYLSAGGGAEAIDPTTGDLILAGTASTSLVQNGTLPAVAVARVLLEPSTGAGVTPPAPTPPASFDGTDQTDLAVYLPGLGDFAFRAKATSGGPDSFIPFGPAGAGQTIPAAADYAGDGQDQIAAYLPASGIYAIRPSGDQPGLFVQFGIPGAGQTIPVPADYYGTGHDDVAIYMPAIASFAIMAVDGQPAREFQFGAAGPGQSIPAPADYYNTGQDDIAVYLAQAGAFAILAPGGASGEIIPFGKPGIGQSIPVPGDYDGSGKTELAVYIPSLGAFYYRPADGGPDVEVPFGTPNSGEIPVPGDYDGSGRTEFAVYDPTRGFIAYRPADGGPDQIIAFGGTGNGAIPVAASAGNLPEFTGESPGAGATTNAIRPASVAPASTALASTSAINSSRALAVPAGPTLASARVALSLVNQGDDDSSALTP